MVSHMRHRYNMPNRSGNRYFNRVLKLLGYCKRCE